MIDVLTAEQIFVLYERLHNKAEVARRLGVSPTTVAKYIEQEGLIISKERVKITPEVVQKINELYAKYRNQARVARELGISNTTVKRHLTPENLAISNQIYDDRDALWYYIIRLFGVYDAENDIPVDGHNIQLMNTYVKKGINYRAQLLILKWFYEIKKNKVQDKYKTIGIIPHIYTAALNYYKQQAHKAQEINEGIKKQLEQDRVEIPYNPNNYLNKRKKKNTIDLDSVGDIDD